jgi:hypothetical protein
MTFDILESAGTESHGAGMELQPDISNMIWRILIGESTGDGVGPQKRKGRAKAASNLTNAIHRAGQLESVVLEFLQTYRQAARRAQIIKQADFADATEIHRLCEAMSADSRRCLFLMESMSSLVGEQRGKPAAAAARR